MSKVFMFALEKVMTAILVLFFFLNFQPNNTSSILLGLMNVSEMTIHSLDKMVDSYTIKSVAGQQNNTIPILLGIMNMPQATIYSLSKMIDSHRAKSAAAQQNQTAVVSGSENVKFNRAVAFILRHEGGLVNDKSDSGGITNYGISYVYLHHLLVREPKYLSLFSLKTIAQFNPSIIKHMTLQQAKKIYRSQWWKKYHFGAIKNHAIATKVFDYAVNMGPTRAIKLLQIASQKQSKTSYVKAHGQLNNATITYINSLNDSQARQLLYAYEKVVSNYYLSIAKHHPKDKKFLVGWLKRAYDNKFITA